jgi:hypothetical protein
LAAPRLRQAVSFQEGDRNSMGMGFGQLDGGSSTAGGSCSFALGDAQQLLHQVSGFGGLGEMV